MKIDRAALATMLAVSAAALAGCDQRDCRDQAGRPVSCNHRGGGGFFFFGGGRGAAPSDAAAPDAARGGFGAHGGSGGGE